MYKTMEFNDEWEEEEGDIKGDPGGEDSVVG